MAESQGKPKEPNIKLHRFLVTYGISRKALAYLVNQIAAAQGQRTSYKHSSVGNWIDGMRPKDPIPAFIATALSQRIGRPVDLDEIGLGVAHEPDALLGWNFPRDRTDAIRGVQSYWSGSAVDRRTLLGTGTFAAAAYTSPVLRWLAVPADTTSDHRGGHRVGRSDLAQLWEASDQARRWDSKFGGGDWRSSSVARCLEHQAVPLLDGTFTDEVGRELFTATAELARVVAWSAFDGGQHAIAQKHFIQALRLAKAGGDIEMGAYILTTMSLQSMLEGHPDQALDMAQGAYERARGHAAPRVLAFAQLAQARAHGRLGDAAGATTALGHSEDLLNQIRPGSRDPQWLDYFTPARLAADATEVYCDLGKPATSLAWNQRAEAMPAAHFTRATGIRYAVVATSHLRDRDLDRGLATGYEAADILAQVSSSRARRYLTSVTGALEPWKGEPAVRDFIHHAGALGLTQDQPI